MKTLICGSLAYDTIMVFPDRFARHILADQAQMLSVSFTIGEMRREWGGCAGNIAYNLRGLGGNAAVLATLGHDGDDYRARLVDHGVDTNGVRTLADAYTAQAFIITDLDDNQITAFHPGAMARSHEISTADVADVTLGIVAPDGREGMLRHADEFARAGIPFILDPGQAMTLFSGDELMQMIDAATVVAVNDYEARLLAERTGCAARGTCASRRRSDRHARRGRLGGARGRPRAVDTGGTRRRHHRSHRLRRRLSRGPAARHARALGLGPHGAAGGDARRAEDRLARRPEPRGQPRHRRRVIPG